MSVGLGCRPKDGADRVQFQAGVTDQIVLPSGKTGPTGLAASHRTDTGSPTQIAMRADKSSPANDMVKNESAHTFTTGKKYNFKFTYIC